MKWTLVFAVGVMLAVASTGTMAFEEQKMKPQDGGAALGATPGKPSGDAGLGITSPDLALPSGSAGTKIRVPGLGIIGEIPKMDFGLELLYGANQNKQPENNDRNEANGVMFRSKIPIGTPR